MAKKRRKIIIEYKGTDYFGWQRQEDNVPTIQGEIEKALLKFCQKNIDVHVAGRTDAGVHAIGQAAHFDLDYGDRPLSGFELLKALNAHLRPQPISIIHAEVVADDFSARFAAINKLYRYRIVQRPSFLALERGLVWHYKRPLNVDKMQKAAQYLIGHHDFTSFRDSQCQANSPERTLDRLEIFAKPYDAHGGHEVVLEAEAMSFLHHQIRNFVGTLVLVGEGKWEPEDVKTVLEKRDRKAAGITAPADGLYLVRIDYKE